MKNFNQSLYVEGTSARKLENRETGHVLRLGDDAFGSYEEEEPLYTEITYLEYQKRAFLEEMDALHRGTCKGIRPMEFSTTQIALSMALITIFSAVAMFFA